MPNIRPIYLIWMFDKYIKGGKRLMVSWDKRPSFFICVCVCVSLSTLMDRVADWYYPDGLLTGRNDWIIHLPSIHIPKSSFFPFSLFCLFLLIWFPPFAAEIFTGEPGNTGRSCRIDFSRFESSYVIDPHMFTDVYVCRERERKREIGHQEVWWMAAVHF